MGELDAPDGLPTYTREVGSTTQRTALNSNNRTLRRWFGVQKEGRSVAQIEDIQVEIEALSREEFVQLKEWFAEKEWEHWDTQLEGDAEAGKLDFLLEEAADAKAQGNLQDL